MEEKCKLYFVFYGGVGQGVNLTGYEDSPHVVSQYLFIHSRAVKAIIKEI